VLKYMAQFGYSTLHLSTADSIVSNSLQSANAVGLTAGDLEASLSDYNSILNREPCHIDALYYRGTVYEKLGQLDEAIADLSEVLRLDPNHVKAAYARGACRNLQGEFSQAIGNCDVLVCAESFYDCIE
jgi:tetratricopeptide (TPR) repeat protein